MSLRKTSKATRLHVAVFAALLSASVGHAQTVYVMGIPSCGRWVEDRGKDSWAHVANRGWLIGYLSGIATGTGKDFIRGTDIASLVLWVDNFCKANPLKDVSDAGADLSRELIAAKRL